MSIFSLLQKYLTVVMKIVTWNINGLRASKHHLKNLIAVTNADIVCLQETKITKDMLTSDEALVDGYNSYFSFSQKRAGYSGVATFCKNAVTPIKAQTGLGNTYEDDAGADLIGCYGNLASMFTADRLKEIDLEGRAVITLHELKNSSGNKKKLAVINVYCPRADCDDHERNHMKLDFYKALEERAKALIKEEHYVIILGDINTSHKLIDHCDPSEPVLFFDNLSRMWLNSFMFNSGDYSCISDNVDDDFEKGCFVDCFRYFYPHKPNMFTCWCTSNRARETNFGTRIDYIFSDIHLLKFAKITEILTDFQGSDHCPVVATFSIDIVTSKTFPALCTSSYSEFGGKQQKLSSYFTSKINNVDRKRAACHSTLNSNCKIKVKDSKNSQLKLTSIFSAVSNDTNYAVEVKTKDVSKTSLASKPSKNSNTQASLFWKKLLKGPEPLPLCSGHNEECVKRTVKKEGPNYGRQFYCCARPEGHKSNPEARCQFFKWC